MKHEQVNKSLPLQYPLMGWNGFQAINASRSTSFEGVDPHCWLSHQDGMLSQSSNSWKFRNAVPVAKAQTALRGSQDPTEIQHQFSPSQQQPNGPIFPSGGSSGSDGEGDIGANGHDLDFLTALDGDDEPRTASGGGGRAWARADDPPASAA
eukprot:CAMPEP_0172178948 /NCGR_PEP_ID=MMETSP1050-20130122/16331_1 /TAXON_ID=233186 /ORGANISM="Cryptomonas curvata, Strain CCAP979/52" /LENGTH=151 /DNA_ID=CAMNT_0012851747 /DNA_START=200 /DNA_END=652 /DNA_ORIENTATION=-